MNAVLSGKIYYNHTSMINEYELTLFVREDEEASLYRNIRRAISKKAYTIAGNARIVRKSRTEIRCSI